MLGYSWRYVRRPDYFDTNLLIILVKFYVLNIVPVSRNFFLWLIPIAKAPFAVYLCFSKN
jgi:hypothetical protein